MKERRLIYQKARTKAKAGVEVNVLDCPSVGDLLHYIHNVGNWCNYHAALSDSSHFIVEEDIQIITCKRTIIKQASKRFASYILVVWSHS